MIALRSARGPGGTTRRPRARHGERAVFAGRRQSLDEQVALLRDQV